MYRNVKIDLITHNADKSEFALYLIENNPFKDEYSRLSQIQDRIYDVIDIVLDGQLASDYPDSMGKAVKIVVDCKKDCPFGKVENLVSSLNVVISSDGEYLNDIINSNFISEVSITCVNSEA